MSIRRALGASMLTGFALLASTVFASQEIRIAHVYDKTGPLEAYATQTQTGFMMGLRYATGGTMTVAGKKIVVIERDSKGKPDLGKSQLAAAYEDDKADLAVGATSSGVTLAMLPVAEEYKKLLIVEPAVADSITGRPGIDIFFEPGATARRMPFQMRLHSMRRDSLWPHLRKTVPLVVTV